uniref:Cysteine-rich protein n=1 Tax=Spironucleus salmonicida TaxID=348837 RepID=V6LNB4_9EUKA|eukprot:EST42214.1 Cysteine-rich protein [Spironucleus salmonicida]
MQNQLESVSYLCNNCGYEVILRLSNQNHITPEQVKCQMCKKTILFKKRTNCTDMIDCR